GSRSPARPGTTTPTWRCSPGRTVSTHCACWSIVLPDCFGSVAWWGPSTRTPRERAHRGSSWQPDDGARCATTEILPVVRDSSRHDWHDEHHATEHRNRDRTRRGH